MQKIRLDSNFIICVTLIERSTHSATLILFTRNGIFFVSPCHYVMTHPQLAYERVKLQILRLAANLLTKL